MAEVEAAEAVGGVGGRAVGGVGKAVGAGSANPSADGGVWIGGGGAGVAAAGRGDGVEGRAEVGVVGEGNGAGGAGGVGCEVLGAGGVGAGDDGEDAAGLGGKLDVAGVGEVDAVVAGGGDEDGPGLIGGVCDAVEGGLESGTLAGVEIDENAEGEIDDVGVLGDGVLNTLDDPTEEAAGLSGGALGGDVGRGAGGIGETLEDLDVEEGCGGGDADEKASAGADGGGGQRGDPCAVALLILRRAVVAGAGQACGGGLIYLGHVEGEVGRDVRVKRVDSAVEDGDANACAHGGVPWAVGGTTWDASAEASGLQDGPGLRSGGVVSVVGGGCWGGGWGWNWSRCGCGCADGDPDGGGKDGAEDEGVGGEDAVVDDELDVGVGAQGGDGGGFVVGVGGGFEDSDGKGIIVADDACATEAGAGRGVRGYCAVAVGDEITVRDGRADGAGELLGVRAQGAGE